MLIRTLASILIVASSSVLVLSQTPEGAAKAPKAVDGPRSEKLRDIPFPGGVDLQFLIKDLARDMDLNVLFDVGSFRAPRKTLIDLKNVTAREALDYVLLQEGFISEEVGPKTIMVASRVRAVSLLHINAGVMLIDGQLAEYFGVDRGILIKHVRPDSPGSRAGLKAGDVIVGTQGLNAITILALNRTINEKTESDMTLRIVRDRKEQTISLTLDNGIK